MDNTVHLTAVGFKIGEQAVPPAAPSQPMRRQRRPTLASAVKAAKRAAPAAGAPPEAEANPWDVVLVLRGDHGPH